MFRRRILADEFLCLLGGTPLDLGELLVEDGLRIFVRRHDIVEHQKIFLLMIARRMIAPLDGIEAGLLAQFAHQRLLGVFALPDITRKQLIILIAHMARQKDLVLRAVDDGHRHRNGKEGELEFFALGTVRHEAFVLQEPQREFFSAVHAIHLFFLPIFFSLFYAHTAEMSTSICKKFATIW